MGTLSNIPFLRGLFPQGDPAPVSVRPARPEEYDPAVRLLLASHSATVDEQHVAEYRRLAHEHQTDAGGLLIAEAGGRLVSTLLPVASPGRTMLIFLPGILAGDVQLHATARLVEESCRLARTQQIQLAQALLDPGHRSAIDLLAVLGFRHIADLLYLHAIPARRRDPQLPPGFEWVSYSQQTHALFAQAILESYQSSLDCPALNGMRDIEDVIAGHRATGDFDPNLWFAIVINAQPAGVLILSRIFLGQALELVYLGISPQFRGKGLGDAMMQQALGATIATGAKTLSLAVDAGNKPALNLYWRHGLKTTSRKTAMLRDLR